MISLVLALVFMSATLIKQSMNFVTSFLGLFAVIGNWPNWERYFDLSRKGLKLSFIILILALPAYYIFISAIYQEGARLQNIERGAVPLPPFIIITSVFLLSRLLGLRLVQQFCLAA